MKKRLKIFPTIIVSLIVFGAFILRILNLNYNSPFLDEAIYIRLGQEFFKGTIGAAGPYSWVGGMPTFYSSISTIGYMVGGILGSRSINVALGTLSVFLIYLFAKQLLLFGKKDLLNKLTGIFSALFFAVLPITIHLSRLAIYDMLSFTLFLSGLIFLQKALQGNENNKNYIPSVIFLILSFLAKYSVLMFLLPLNLILIIYFWRFHKKRIGEITFFAISLILAIGYYIFIHFFDLSQFITTQVINRNAATIVDVFISFGKTTQYLYIPALIGTILFILQKKYQAILLILFALIPVFVHIISLNTRTLPQDLIYSILFLLPLVAGGIVWLGSKHLYLISTLALVLTCSIFLLTSSQRYDFEHYWPNTTDAINFLRINVTSNDRILAEADDVAVIGLNDKLPTKNIVGPYNFSYKQDSSSNAYPKAVLDSYFTYIELEQNGSDFESNIKPELIKNYILVYKKDSIRIYSKRKI